VCHSGEVQENLSLSFISKATDRSMQGQRSATNSHPAFQVEHNDISCPALVDIKINHLRSPFPITWMQHMR
jgi:hypothetical protein